MLGPSRHDIGAVRDDMSALHSRRKNRPRWPPIEAVKSGWRVINLMNRGGASDRRPIRIILALNSFQLGEFLCAAMGFKMAQNGQNPPFCGGGEGLRGLPGSEFQPLNG